MCINHIHTIHFHITTACHATPYIIPFNSIKMLCFALLRIVSLGLLYILVNFFVDWAGMFSSSSKSSSSSLLAK